MTWSPQELPRYDGGRVLVTGGNSGIGRYVAAALAERGAEVTPTTVDR